VLGRKPASHRALAALTGYGGGFLLALTLVELIPAALDVPNGALVALAGYLLVHLTQHALTPHFHYGEETHGEAMVSRGIGVWALVGLLPHSFFDGVAIGGGFLRSAELGALIVAGVLLHKIPTGVSLASVMLASGNSRRRTLLALSGVALATVLGAGLTPAVSALVRYGLALAAGVTLYVAASNLVPESQRERSGLVQAGVFSGAATFLLARWVLEVL
jgi:ZIP family zinc transporter/zinc and cadmium transporter